MQWMLRLQGVQYTLFYRNHPRKVIPKHPFSLFFRKRSRNLISLVANITHYLIACFIRPWGRGLVSLFLVSSVPLFFLFFYGVLSSAEKRGISVTPETSMQWMVKKWYIDPKFDQLYYRILCSKKFVFGFIYVGHNRQRNTLENNVSWKYPI